MKNDVLGPSCTFGPWAVGLKERWWLGWPVGEVTYEVRAFLETHEELSLWGPFGVESFPWGPICFTQEMGGYCWQHE